MSVKSISRAKVYAGQRRDLHLDHEPALGGDPRLVVRQLRREWLQRFAWRFALFVAIPTTLASLYYGLVASNQYESTAVVMIQEIESGEDARPEHLLKVNSNLSGSARQLAAMREYILSRTMLQKLDEEIGLLRHFENPTWDYFARLRGHPTLEHAFAYFGKKMAADFDSASGTISLRARAFEPRMAQTLAQTVIRSTASKLDEMTEHMRSLSLKDAELQLESAKTRLVTARLVAARSRDAVEPRRATSGTTDDPVGSAAAKGAASNAGNWDEKLERANLELAFAEKAYDSSVSVLAELRAREIRRRPVLVTLVKPSLPDNSAYPRRLASVFAVFIFSLLALGIGSLTVTAIREHAHL